MIPPYQAQGFIEDLLVLFGKPHLRCPDYTLLSKRLNTLGLTTPCFKRPEGISDDIVAIAIDSTYQFNHIKLTHHFVLCTLVHVNILCCYVKWGREWIVS